MISNMTFILVVLLILFTVLMAICLIALFRSLFDCKRSESDKHISKKKKRPDMAALTISTECETIDMAKDQRRGRRMKKLEFSKLILIALFTVDVAVTIFTCRMVAATGDTTVLCYLIPSVSAASAIGINAYYSKAKVENRIKLAKAYDINITEQSLSENF